MKKIITKQQIIAGSLVAVNILAFGLGGVAFAQQTIQQVIPVPPGAPTTVGGLVGLINAVARWIYLVFFIVAAIFFIFAAFTYLTSRGDETKVKTAKNMIIYAVVAIAVALMATAFQAIVTAFLGNPNA